MKVFYRRLHRINGEYPLRKREKFLKDIKQKCNIYLIGYEWVSLKGVLDEHKEYDKAYPKLADNFTPKQIKDGLARLLDLGYLEEKVI